MVLQLKEIVHTTADSTTLRFKASKVIELYRPGQHGILLFSIDGQKFTRTYSFHTVSDLDSDPAITVRTITNGVVSNHLKNSNTTNLHVELIKVTGDFFIQPSVQKARHVVMFAGGSGITPLAAMCKAILFQEPGSIVSLVYSNRSSESIILKDELSALENEFSSRFKIYHVLTDGTDSAETVPVFFKGRLSKLIVRKLIKGLTDEREKEFYLCGPRGFMEMTEDALRSLAVPVEQVFKETFFDDSKEAFDFNNLPERKIVFQTSRGFRHVLVESGKSLLQAGLENGLALKYSCRQGQCGTCQATLLQGEVKLKQNYILTSEELKAGQTLLCQSFPVSDDVMIRIDA